MVVAAILLFGMTALLASRRPDICFMLGFPALVFMGQLKAYFPVSVSATAAIFPLAAGAGFLLRGGRIRFGPCEKLMIALGLSMAFSLRYTSAPTYGRDKTVLFFFLVLPVVVLAPNIIRSVKSLRLAIFILFGTLAVYVLTSVVLRPQVEGIGERVSVINDVIVAAQYLGLAIIIGFSYLLFGKTSAIGQYFIVCMLPLEALLLFMTGTRGPVFALIVVMLFAYWFLHTEGFKALLYKSRQTYVIIAVVSGLMFSGYFVLKNVLPVETYNRFASVEAFFSDFTSSEVRNWETSSTRILRYMSAANAFFDYPLTGVGAGGYRTVLLEGNYRGLKRRALLLDEAAHVYPHNVILEFACEQGMLGLIAILWVIYLNFKMICGLKKVYHSEPQKHFALCFCAMVYFFGLCVSMTSLDIPRMMIFWWGMGLLLVADRIYGKGESILPKSQAAQSSKYVYVQGRHENCLKSR